MFKLKIYAGDYSPVKSRFYRMPIHKRVEQVVQEILEVGIVERFQSS